MPLFTANYIVHIMPIYVIISKMTTFDVYGRYTYVHVANIRQAVCISVC